MPDGGELLEHGIERLSEARRNVVDHSCFNLIGPGCGGDDHACQLEISVRVVGNREKDPDRIAPCKLEDPADLRFLTVVVVHCAEHSGQGISLGGSAGEGAIDDLAALGRIDGCKCGWCLRSGLAGEDAKRGQGEDC